MSTNDVPGSKFENHDELGIGCWAEHDDGSLILVESAEGDRVVYSVFDMATDPITEYRDAMPIKDFEKQFSWDTTLRKKNAIKWIWHDKTAFPWDRIIKEGAKDGLRHASAKDLITAAERVAKSRNVRGKPFDEEAHAHKLEQVTPTGKGIISRIQKAFTAFKNG